MLVFENLFLTDLSVSRSGFTKKESVHVSPRCFHSLSFRLSGKITVDGKISSADSVTFIPQGWGYDTEVLEDGEIIVIHFNLAGDRGLSTAEITSVSDPRLFRQLFEQLLESSRYTRVEGPLGLSLFYRILHEWELCAAKHGDVHVITPRMKNARARIERDYADTSLNVSALARQAGVSEVYFRREFTAAFGCTPIAYIRLVRLNNAKSLLQSGRCNVTDTALLCGYDSLSYFSYDFRRMMGISPRAYIRIYEEKQEC